MTKSGKTLRLSDRLEDYIEAILVLIRQYGVARVRDIAAATNVSKSSVTAALKRLVRAGLVQHAPYEFVVLTDRGEKLAKQILQKHNLLVSFLVNVLGIDQSVAEENACRMEHVVDNKVLERLNLLASYIQQCPMGGEDWLERFSAYVKQRESGMSTSGDNERSESRGKNTHDTQITLEQLKPGQQGRVKKIAGEGITRQRLMDMGLTPGADFIVERVAPLGDPVEIKVRNYHLSLRKDEASNIIVEPMEQ